LIDKTPNRKITTKEKYRNIVLHCDWDVFHDKPPITPVELKRKREILSEEKQIVEKLAKRIKKDEKSKQKQIDSSQSSYDLWNPQVKLHSNPDFLNTTFGLTKPTKVHTKQKLSNIQAISIPTPGESYRPTSSDHQNLINQFKKKKSETYGTSQKITTSPK